MGIVYANLDSVSFFCTIGADLQPSFQFEASANNLLVRGVRNPNVQITVTVELMEGVSFPPVEYPRRNIDLTMLLSKDNQPDLNCHGDWKQCYSLSVNNTSDASIPQSGINTTVSRNVTFPISLDVLFSPEECFDIKFLCVHLGLGYDFSYIEIDPSNNLHCQDVASSILCKPGKMFLLYCVCFLPCIYGLMFSKIPIIVSSDLKHEYQQ